MWLQSVFELLKAVNYEQRILFIITGVGINYATV